MKRIALVILALTVAAWSSAQTLLPYPQKVEWGQGTVKKAPSLLPLWGSATDREGSLGHAADSAALPQRGSGEGASYYCIRITKDGVRVGYTDEASRHYAEATLRQLEVRKGEYRCCTIEDWPQYAWRGAMIDVSRHFFTIEHLKKQVDILAQYKINRLHLHLVDAAGWRMEIKRYPRLTEMAAHRTESDWNKWWIGKDRRYVASPIPPPSLSPSKLPSVIGFSRSPKRELCHPSPVREGEDALANEEGNRSSVISPSLTGEGWQGAAGSPDGERLGERLDSASSPYGGYYTQDELRSLVAYAAERGVTVVPEIEMPGHSEEVLHAYPELSCTHREGAADFCPGNVGTYDFLENVLREVMDVFPSEYIHVGGDEAGRADWPACPRCQQKLKEIGGNDFRDLQTYLIAHMGRFLESHGRKLVGWDEVIDKDLHPGTTVMVWRGVEKAAEAARLGLDVVMTPGAYCYFDSYQDAPPTQPEGFGSYLPLEKVYSFNPVKNLSPEEAAHIKGVQGNLWTEYVPTPEHQEYMLYPRILALAEIGWGTGGRSDFRQRAEKEVDRLRQNGVNAFNLRTEVGERPGLEKPQRHKAVGALVAYEQEPAPQYSGRGNTTLVDGCNGGWAFGDGRWQGFIKRGESGYVLQATLDLQRPVSFKEVSTCFRQDCCAEIYYPVEYVVSTSADGRNWTEMGRISTPYRRTPTPEVRDFTVHSKTTARYIRVQANNGPDGGWLFLDEIKVR